MILRIFIVIASFVTAASGVASGEIVLPKGYTLAKIIEAYAQQIISPHLDPTSYFLIVEVEGSGEDDAKNTDVGQVQDSLPYTTLTTNLEALKQAIAKKDVALSTLKFTLLLTIDEAVPAAVGTLINKKLRFALAINDKERQIESKSTVLKSQQKVIDDSRSELEQQKLQIEKSKLEMERGKLASEREKLEAIRREEGLLDKIKKYEAEVKELSETAKKSTKAEPEKETAKDPVVAEQKLPAPPDPGVLGLLRDFQLPIAIFILAIFLILGVILASGAHRKGLDGLSSAVGIVGEGLAASGGGGGGSGEDSGTTESSANGGQLIAPAESEVVNKVDLDSQNPEKRLEFLRLVEEKIEVLSNEANFNFYRHFLDLTVERIEYAAAILVSVNTETAKTLVSYLPTEAIAAIREYISAKDGLTQAQKLRSKALQNFYGRIAFDEFMDSPLMKVKEAGWLVRLSNDDIRDLAFELDHDLRVLFLSCFTPTRLAIVLEGTASDKKDMLISAIKEVDKRQGENLASEIKRIKDVHQNLEDSRSRKVRSLIDGPRFFAKIIEDLSPGTREQFVRAMEDRADLIEQIKKYYIPFDSVAKLAQASIREIFGNRPSKQIALILFGATTEVRTKVISGLSEAQQDGVKEELEVLDSNKEQEKRNRKRSIEMQSEVCHTLLRMNQEGLLNYEDGTPGSAADKAWSAA